MEEQKPDLTQLEENVNKSQAEFPPGMAPKMLKLAKMLNELENKLDPLISKAHHEVLNKMPPLERSKMGLMEVYTINSLFWTLMRTSGENVDSTLKEDYKIEMGRLKETQGRLAEVEARAHRQRVNVEAASRFIHHGLGIYRRMNEAEGTEEESQNLIHSDVVRAQKKKYRKEGIYPRTSDHQDTVDYARDHQEQEEAYPQASSLTKIKKKRKNGMENSFAESSADVSREVSLENSGYQGSAEESFNTSPPKKIKTGKKMKKAKAIVGENSFVTPEVKKIKKKKLVKGADAIPSSDIPPSNKVKKKINKPQVDNTDSDRTGYRNEDNEVAVVLQMPKKKKKNKQLMSKKHVDISSCLDTTGSEIAVQDVRDCTNKNRDWYEQGWT